MTDGWAQKYIRTNPYAGPEEQRLRKVLNANTYQLNQAAQEWNTNAQALQNLERMLVTQGNRIEDAYSANGSNGTGGRAARAFRDVAAMVERRSVEMHKMREALGDAATAVETAQASYRSLPHVSPPFTGDRTGGHTGDTPESLTRRQQAQQDAASADAKHQAEYQEAERQARAALTKLDGDMESATDKMRPVAGLDRTSSPTTGTTTAGPSSAGVVGSTAPAPVGGPKPTPAPGVIAQPVPVEPGLAPGPGTPPPSGGQTPPVLQLPGAPGTNPDSGLGGGLDGDLSGGSDFPGATVPSGAGSAPTPGVSAGGAAGAVGAGMIAGGGAIAGLGGAAGGRPVASGRTVALGGQAGARGAGARGALGRTTVAAGQGTSGRTGAGARGGRTVAAGQGNAGRAGARGAAGSRGTAAGAGGQAGRKGGKSGRAVAAGGRKGPLSAAATGGKRGKRDEGEEASRDALAFEDEQTWLDDEQTTDAVLD